MRKEFSFKIGKDMLRGTLFIPRGTGPFPAVIFFHGSGGVGEMYFDLAKRISEKGIVGMAFNYRGAGLSNGAFEDQTLEMGIQDATAALNFLLSLEIVNKEKIGICGGSFGGFLAALLSSKFSIKSLILNVPAAYSELDLTKQRDFAGELNKRTFRDSKAYEEISLYKGKLLIIESEFDNVLLPGMVKEYLNRANSASKKEHYLLKGAKHRVSNNPPIRKILTKKIIDWFLKTL